MTTYRKIHGRSIQAVTTDPSESVAEGQVWYNTTSDTFKSVLVSEAFSSSSPLTTTREGAGAFGTQTTAVIFGGETPSVSGATEEYNGTGFSAGGTMNTARYRLQGTAGTATAGIVFGGVEPAVSNKTETYNGTAWTTSPYTLNTARWCAGAGTQTSALAFGGGPGHKNNSEEFDGEGWTATPTLNTSRNSLSGAGANAEECLAFGGETSTPPAVATNATESWDGTSWTEVNNLNTARYGGYGAGTQSAAFLAGGIVGPGTMQSAAETWDGTNWTSSPASLATARGRLSVAGSSTAAIAMAGQTPSITTATEEYNLSANVITAAAWSAGATYPLSLNQLGGSGTQTAGLCFGGNLPPGNPNGSNQTKEYDGSAWTAGGNLNIGKNTGSRSGVGTQTASMAINFRNDGSPPVSPVNYIAMTNVEEYNGSSWTAGTATPDGEVEAGTCGTISAALRFGGNPGNPPGGPYANSTIYWNDSSWTSLNNMSTARSGLAPAFQGTYNAALGFGGETATPTTLSSTEEFDGTNWTAGGNLNTAAVRHCGSGTQTAALSFGGNPSVTRTEGYDGTAWSTRPSLANGRKFGGGAGSSTAALYMCGDGTTHVEEFTGETTAANIADFTTS